MLIPIRTNKPADPKAVEKAYHNMQSTLKQMEEIWLDGGKKKFLIGDEITVADLLGVCELEQPGRLTFRNIGICLDLKKQNLKSIFA